MLPEQREGWSEGEGVERREGRIVRNNGVERVEYITKALSSTL